VAVVVVQIISKVLNTGEYGFFDNNLITDEDFKGTGYEEEYEFITSHYKKYGNVPDKTTFLSKFPEFEIVEVQDSDKYLIDTFREEKLYRKAVPIVQRVAELLQTDANAASEYMIQAIKDLQPNYDLSGVDLISQGEQRLEHFKDRLENQDDWYFTTGFKELDDVIHGIQRGEELFVIFARTNQGKSWVLEKIMTHIWQTGFNVGYISPEMSADSIGYRFDTLNCNYSNKGLLWGNSDVDLEAYEEYIEGLKEHKNSFICSTPIDFDRKITVSKLRRWAQINKLDAIAIDGITYMTDERMKRGDNKTTSLTNISEDLMMLSIELKIPILVVVQANRTGVVDAEKGGTPDLESIRDSDGISHNASKVLSIRQDKDGMLEMGIKKQRFGAVGGKLKYSWNIDKGIFEFVPEYDDTQEEEHTERQIRRERKNIEKTDMF